MCLFTFKKIKEKINAYFIYTEIKLNKKFLYIREKTYFHMKSTRFSQPQD
jgi:hypothetical protein